MLLAALALASPAPVRAEPQELQNSGAPAPGCNTPCSQPQPLPPIDQHLIGRMLVQQAGGIALADRAIPRLRDPRLRVMAETFRRQQRQDQALLAGWYHGWFGQPVPSWTPQALQLPGLVLDPQAIETASDGDRAFVDQAVPYLRLGLMMALQAMVHTSRQELLAFEQRLVQRHSAEIRALEAWSLQRPAP